MALVLYLIRHAKSSWANENQKDYDRPLNTRGKDGLRVMQKHLQTEKVVPDWVWYSTAVRTTLTMEGITKHLPKDKILLEGRQDLYHASSEKIIETIASTPDNASVAWYIGHNPGITDAVNSLCNAGISNMPTLGIAKIKFEVDTWKAIHPNLGILEDFIYPKALDPSL